MRLSITFILGVFLFLINWILFFNLHHETQYNTPEYDLNIVVDESGFVTFYLTLTEVEQ